MFSIIGPNRILFSNIVQRLSIAKLVSFAQLLEQIHPGYSAADWDFEACEVEMLLPNNRNTKKTIVVLVRIPSEPETYKK